MYWSRENRLIIKRRCLMPGCKEISNSGRLIQQPHAVDAFNGRCMPQLVLRTAVITSPACNML